MVHQFGDVTNVSVDGIGNDPDRFGVIVCFCNLLWVLIHLGRCEDFDEEFNLVEFSLWMNVSQLFSQVHGSPTD